MMNIMEILDDFIVEQIVPCNLIDLLVLDPEKTLLEVSFGGKNLLVQSSIGGIWRFGRLTAL